MAVTKRSAVALSPLFDWSAVTGPVMLCLTPALVAVTWTETVQLVPVAMLGTLTPIAPEPELEPVIVAPEAQVVAPETGLARTVPGGNGSEAVTLVSVGFPAGLPNVNVSVVTPPTEMVEGTKFFTSVGGTV